MKFALLSDIHANLPALLAALEVVERAGVERVFVAGDVVGDGPHPREVIAALMQRDIPAIRGNVDRKVLVLGESRKALKKKLEKSSGQKRNRVWAALQLAEAEEERAWLAALPTELLLEIGGRPVLVVHGSPLGDADSIYPSLTPEALESKLEGWQGTRPALLVCGHTHVPFGRRVGDVMVVNCGSVGRPVDGDPRGSLAVVEIDGAAGIRTEFVRFAYPVDDVVDALEAREVPGIDAKQYRRGIKS